MRHAYARRTYLQLTGYACPADGGNGAALSRAQDREARLIIADRLGHARESITTAYLGPRSSRDEKAETLHDRRDQYPLQFPSCRQAQTDEPAAL